MKNTITILVLSIILNSCGHSETRTESVSENSEKTYYKVEKYHYDSLTIPIFFKTLIKNHTKDFFLIDSLEFNQFCLENNLAINDSSNIVKYFTISILHEIFTCQTASNCSRGEILNIPYQWHWTVPNPRHEIYFTNSKRLLKDIKPPKEFSKYNSYADIDRTPYLFLGDLVNSEFKYYSASCDTFSTFGWCSEREMAFVALTALLDYKGKVVAEGNHSWSEFLIPLKLITGEIQNFRVNVDNTFNSVQWTKIKQQEISEWEKYFGNTSLSVWYNQKAKSISDLRNIENHLVPNKSMSRIEHEVVEFLDIKINER
ncbi:MAG: hypothetical protein RBT65_18905 [Methanolobus sp.]|nr:hypothetical protein [Methanolobus sp.]